MLLWIHWVSPFYVHVFKRIVAGAVQLGRCLSLYKVTRQDLANFLFRRFHVIKSAHLVEPESAFGGESFFCQLALVPVIGC
uniref:Uncharacterized protein n=1 Tax=Oryza brachyantha TaxID=4533 RepID=J3NBF0_ORYBR